MRTRSSPELDDRDEFLGSDYAVVKVAPSLGLVSLSFFVAALASPYWVYYLPLRFEHSWQRPVLVPIVTFVLALLGLLGGFFGRRSKHPGLARLGLFLNGVICGLMLLMIAGLVVWWHWRR